MLEKAGVEVANLPVGGGGGVGEAGAAADTPTDANTVAHPSHSSPTTHTHHHPHPYPHHYHPSIHIRTYISLEFVQDHVLIPVQPQGAKEAVVLRPVLRCRQNGTWNRNSGNH